MPFFMLLLLARLFYSEYRRGKFLRNVGFVPTDFMALYIARWNPFIPTAARDLNAAPTSRETE
jgi:hypothetical protein